MTVQSTLVSMPTNNGSLLTASSTSDRQAGSAFSTPQSTPQSTPVLNLRRLEGRAVLLSASENVDGIMDADELINEAPLQDIESIQVEEREIKTPEANEGKKTVTFSEAIENDAVPANPAPIQNVANRVAECRENCLDCVENCAACIRCCVDNAQGCWTNTIEILNCFERYEGFANRPMLERCRRIAVCVCGVGILAGSYALAYLHYQGKW